VVRGASVSALDVLEELGRRDEAAAAALAEVEDLRGAAERIRAGAERLLAFFAALPDEREQRVESLRQAEAARAEAESELALAEQELERVKRDKNRAAAARAVEAARDTAHAAAAEVERLHAAAARLEEDAERAQAEAHALEEEARRRALDVAATPRLAADAVAPPSASLQGVADWGARVRPGLLLLGSALAGEREAIVREANELGSAVVGEPLATSVTGVRKRVAQALERATT
jgi:hypothetical protein